MSTMIMNMSQGDIERDEPAMVEYEDEVMYSGWNPVISMTQLMPENKTQEDKRKFFPAELANVDMELFLQKMYD